ncbi:SCP2 sterol-binding domain-containing protein [Alcanivorax hongdengensis]|uniref:SCP2 sterol-binding domain-containing protein n=1 Tax=Alcanivorax hongdengensis TaxID=519051 RepID=UPI001ED9B07E|nr:SCP2 sterol-binding domain-containing protein [Alcanivorax hongdengensis]
MNQALTGTAAGRERLAALHGTVVRIRAERPRWVLYVLIYEDGIELLTEYEGSVDIRVRGPLGAMLGWVFSSDNLEDQEALRVNGDEARVAQLAQLLQHFSLWPLIRNWLDDHVRLKELLAVLRREDPVWLEKLATLPSQVGELAEQMARQQLLQEDILDEVRGLREEMRRARKLDLFFMLVGTLLILLSLLKAMGQWQSTWQALQHDTLSLAMLSLGLACLVARLLPRRS